MFIERVLTSLFGELKSESYLHGTDAASFVKRAAYYLGEINATHPFREGNGRSQREFLRQLAVQAGRRFSWVDLDEQANTEASILSHTRRDNSGLERILEEALCGD
jgi:cell filamentation protein